MLSLNNFPDETLEHIFRSGLHPKHLGSVSRVCHRWRVLAYQARVWIDAMGEIGTLFHCWVDGTPPNDRSRMDFLSEVPRSVTYGHYIVFNNEEISISTYRASWAYEIFRFRGNTVQTTFMKLGRRLRRKNKNKLTDVPPRLRQLRFTAPLMHNLACDYVRYAARKKMLSPSFLERYSIPANKPLDFQFTIDL